MNEILPSLPRLPARLPACLLALLLVLAPATSPAATVRMETALGSIDIELFEEDAPGTVANFLGYVTRGDYDDTIVHRSVPGFAIQGGGFFFDGIQFTEILADPPIPNEPGISNTRGTIAMAKLPDLPDSATGQWFFNLDDNGGFPSFLDFTNGGFTVFGQVLHDGMEVVDRIASQDVWEATVLNPAFSNLPLIDYAGGSVIPHLVTIDSVTVIPDPPPQETWFCLGLEPCDRSSDLELEWQAGRTYLLSVWAEAPGPDSKVCLVEARGRIDDGLFDVDDCVNVAVGAEGVAECSITDDGEGNRLLVLRFGQAEEPAPQAGLLDGADPVRLGWVSLSVNSLGALGPTTIDWPTEAFPAAGTGIFGFGPAEDGCTDPLEDALAAHDVQLEIVRFSGCGLLGIELLLVPAAGWAGGRRRLPRERR